MARYVAVLEDDDGRAAEMLACLGEILPRYEPVLFDNAGEMIAWLDDHLGEVVLISLDHDLPLRQTRDGRAVDAGTGRMVADFLASREPTCPVIVHTSNPLFAPGMVQALTDGGWQHCRVYPCDEHRWVRAAWADAVRDYVRRGWVFD